MASWNCFEDGILLSKGSVMAHARLTYSTFELLDFKSNYLSLLLGFWGFGGFGV